MKKKSGRPSTLSALDKKNLKAFGAVVRELREKKKLNVFDVTGDDMPIKSRQHWHRIEAGTKNINLSTIFKVAHTLDVAPYELFKGLN